jgi:hypothetical protein
MAHELGLKDRFRTLDHAVKRGRHVGDDRMSDVALGRDHPSAGVALVPGPVELLGRAPELHNEVAGQVLGLSLAALLSPELDQGCLIAAHDNPSVRAPNEGATISLSSPHPRLHPSNSMQ